MLAVDDVRFFVRAAPNEPRPSGTINVLGFQRGAILPAPAFEPGSVHSLRAAEPWFVTFSTPRRRLFDNLLIKFL